MMPELNTSKPSLNGTLTKLNLVKEGTFFLSVATFEINNLAALLPISIAASFKF
jgi:hypothetical protein